MSDPENWRAGSMYSPRPQMKFRLLCREGRSFGCFIGAKGRSVKELENETGCTIRAENGVVNVTGQAFMTTAEDGLLRAFERILELEMHPDNGTFGCRLLCPSWQFSIAQPAFQNIADITGTHIRAITNTEELHQICSPVNPDDVLIQITGAGVVAVKGALLVLAQILRFAAFPSPYYRPF